VLQRAAAEYARHDWHVVADGAQRYERLVRGGLLLATGRTFDVIEVPTRLGHPAHTLLSFRGVRCPTAVTPSGRWMFFVTTGALLRPDLAGRLDVIRHSVGSIVPAPPTRYRTGRVRWVLPPALAGWALADPAVVQRALAAATHLSLPRQRHPWWALEPAR
jgi:hypothetical protein